MSARTLTLLLLLESGQVDLAMQMLELGMSASHLGVAMQVATDPAQLRKVPRNTTASHVLVIAGLDAPDHDAIGLISALRERPCLGVIAVVENSTQRSLALGAGADLALSSLDREGFLAAVQWLLDVYGPAAPPEDGAVAGLVRTHAPSLRDFSWRLGSEDFTLYAPNGRRLHLDVPERRFLQALFGAEDSRLSRAQCQMLLQQPGMTGGRRALMRTVHRLRQRCHGVGVSLPLQGNPRHGYLFLDACGVLDAQFGVEPADAGVAAPSRASRRHAAALEARGLDRAASGAVSPI